MFPLLLPLLGGLVGGGLMGGRQGYPGQTPGINPNAAMPTPPPTQLPGGQFAGRNLPPWLQKVQAGAQRALGSTGDPRMDAMKASLLQSAAPRPKGTSSFLGDIGSALAAGQQAGMESQDQQLRRRLIEAQIGKLQSPNDGQDPARVAEYNFAKQNGFTGSFPEYLNQFYGREQNSPATLQEWEAFSKMTPEQQARYLEMKRSGQLSTIAGVPNYVPPGVGSGVTAPKPLSTLETETDAQRQLRDAAAQGQAQGTARGEAVANLPTIQTATRAALDTVDKMLAHPGMGTATGLSGTLDPRNYIPGTDARNFRVLRNQAQGQVFLDAFQALKGGGAITEVEGLKAEQAKARMDTAQSDEEFRAALNDYKAALQRGLALAEQKAGYSTGGGFGGQPAAPQQQQPGTVNWSDL